MVYSIRIAGISEEGFDFAKIGIGRVFIRIGLDHVPTCGSGPAVVH